MGWKKLCSAGMGGLLVSACAVRPHQGINEPVSIDTPAERLDGERHVQYRVGIRIAAPPAVIWSLLTDAAAYPSWNRSVLSIDGEIAPGSKIRLVSSAAPKRSFKLKVKAFEPQQHMLWGSGGKAFGGERSFRLYPRGEGQTDFVMTESLGGGMMKMIEKKLPDLRESFDIFAADLKTAAERSQKK